MDDLQLHLVRAQPLEGIADRFDRALHVGLEDDAQLFDLAGLDLLVQAFQRDARRGLALRLLTVLAHGGDLAGLTLVGYRDQHVACCRHTGQALHLHGLRGPRALHALARGIGERADAS